MGSGVSSVRKGYKEVKDDVELETDNNDKVEVGGEVLNSNSDFVLDWRTKWLEAYRQIVNKREKGDQYSTIH